MKSFTNKVIWIIGASSGIGQAVAKELAKEGALLVLSARRKQSLITVEANLAGEHQVLPIDVSDSDAVQQAANEIKTKHHRIDSVLFFAAAYEAASLQDMDLEQAKQIVAVNLNGALNTIAAILPIMQEQGDGQIVLCASVAGYFGLPNGQPYSATKAAIINLAESLRLEQTGLDIKVINPGFVNTELTAKNNFKMPMIMTPEQAANEIVKGLKSTRFEIHFPKRFTLLLKFIKLLPYKLYFWFIAKIV